MTGRQVLPVVWGRGEAYEKRDVTTGGLLRENEEPTNMPTTKTVTPPLRKKVPSSPANKNGAKPSHELGSVSFPEKPSEPIKELGQATITLFGEPKIGKTSLCSQFPDTLFMMFEPGGAGLRIYQVNITTWAQFLKYLILLEKDTSRFKTIVIDTVDIAYEKCYDHVLRREKWDSPQDGKWGDGWKTIRREFSDAFDRIKATGRGLIFTSHATDKEFSTKSGLSFQKIVPTMAKQARSYAMGRADIIAFYGFYGKERYLNIVGSDELEGGHRLEENFRTPSGEAVQLIPMGKSPKEAYQNVIKAFQNKQTTPGETKRSTEIKSAELPVRKFRR